MGKIGKKTKFAPTRSLIKDASGYWILLVVQPPHENTVVLRQLYLHHKAVPCYNRSVSWLESSTTVSCMSMLETQQCHLHHMGASGM